MADRQEIFKKSEEVQNIETNQSAIELGLLLENIYKLCYMFVYESGTVSLNNSRLKIQTDDELRAAIKTLFPDISEFS